MFSWLLSTKVRFAVADIGTYKDMLNSGIKMTALQYRLKPCANDFKSTYSEVDAKMPTKYYNKFVDYCMKNAVQFERR